eukprot:TRINITY_DN6383_c0_g1_i1.p1 TRINITY_DN6383_c0_g1~~TRINITY_DN6383_c0_g1_i1.p1  ORF type:complete len:655 (+),score=116.60 TRINITY_DN6383_c0_g1_i1:30-1994(+)
MEETLIKERSQVSFDVDQLIEWRYGGTRYTDILKTVDMMIQRDRYLMKDRFFDLTTSENRRKTMEQVKRYAELMNMIPDEDMRKALNSRMEMYDGSASMRIYVHEVLFNETIATQGSDEQYAKYKDDIKQWNIIGCFAMTELGNSSYLRGLETVAHYDKSTQQFILTSTSPTATKWWIGMSGQTATHTVALAKLVVDGVEQGLNWFVVPLRDRNTGELLPGVSAGHLGEKMGRPGLDNGWIQFTNVVLPLDSMLNRWSKLSPDGVYEPPPNPAIVYATLIGERILALAAVGTHLTPVLTTTTRYSLIRKQGPKSQQIMDFQSHQLFLIPIIARTYMIENVFNTIFGNWTELIQPENLENGSFLMQAQDYHSISAGLKAWQGWWGADALETVRRTMGGHGFSSYNNIGPTIGQYGVITTGGGDNIVLAQQCARFLISSVNRINNGKFVSFSVEYLQDDTGSDRVLIRKGSDLRNLDLLINAMKWLSKHALNYASELLERSMKAGFNKSDAWNENMMECINASRPHCAYLMLSIWNDNIKNSPPELFPLLETLGILVGLQLIQDMADMFLEHGYIDKNVFQMVRQEKKKICQELRPSVIGLVDGFAVPDYIVKSPLGTYSGVDIYENYLKVIQSGPDQGKAEYWDDLIAPLVRPKL